MTVTEFLAENGFRSHGTVANSWDAFRPDGTVMMQLWQAPNQRVRNHERSDTYLKVRCLDAIHFAEHKQSHAVGYAGRFRAIESIESGKPAYAALSAPPTEKRGPGIWAKYANLDRVYPVLAIERPEGADIFVLLARPIPAELMSRGA